MSNSSLGVRAAIVANEAFIMPPRRFNTFLRKGMSPNAKAELLGSMRRSFFLFFIGDSPQSLLRVCLIDESVIHGEGIIERMPTGCQTEKLDKGFFLMLLHNSISINNKEGG